jgi:predicted nucleic acid-binding protein
MKAFLDTNILVYANDSGNARKQEIALDCVYTHIREGTGVVSTQVMQEYAVNGIQKLKQAIPVVMHQLHLIETLQVVIIQPHLVRRGVEIQGMYGLSYWDSLIIAAAESAGCDCLLSEDFNVGQFYCGIPTQNPFDA